MSSVLCFGELLLRLESMPNERLLQSPSLRATFAGAEANVAVSLSYLGHQCELVSSVPANPIGDAALLQLRSHGVATERVDRSSERMPLFYLEHGAMRRASSITYDRSHSALALVESSHFKWQELLSTKQWFHVSGITPAISKSAAASTTIALLQAAAVEIPISFDFNFRSALWPNGIDQAAGSLAEYAQMANVLVASPAEIALMLNQSIGIAHDFETFSLAAKLAFDFFPKLDLLVSSGRYTETVEVCEYEVWLAQRNGEIARRSTRLMGIVDRVGSGDAMMAAVIDSVLLGRTVDETCEFALAAAALQHSVSGDFSMFTNAEVQAAIAQNSAVDVIR